jgi:two-component sensor histidine kinase
MLILLLIMLIISISIFLSKARSWVMYWMGGLLIGWFISMVGFILFISKYGGFYYYVNQILYINDTFRLWLANAPLSIDAISRLLSSGRSIFIFCLLGLALTINVNKILKYRYFMLALNFFIAIINIVIYDPIVYKKIIYMLDSPTLYAISIMIRVWMIVVAMLSIFLIILSYKHTSIPWIKNRILYVLLGVLALVGFYIYIIFMGPLQFADIRTFYFLFHDFSNFNPPITLYEWYFGTILTGCSIIIGVYSLWRYQKIEAKSGNADLSLERKFNTANLGARVFTHAIKNQLIMIDLLLRDIETGLDNDSGKKNVEQSLVNAKEITAKTIGRLDELNKSFSAASLQFEPVASEMVLETVKSRMVKTPPNITIDFQHPSPNKVLFINLRHMTEVMSNIIINSIEAIGDQDNGIVRVSGYCEGDWYVLEVSDNGPGIPKELIKHVFDPFITRKNSANNWGVGLSYAAHIVKYHHGYMQALNDPNRGCIMQIFLPIYKRHD